MWKFDYPIFHAESRDEWRAWLEDNHGSTRGVWLCSWRNTTDRSRCPYPDAVEEAIAEQAEKTGVGKSTLINAFFGEDVAPTGIGQPVTTDFHLYLHQLAFFGDASRVPSIA